MKIIHVIIGLNVGGAELMLKRLIGEYQGNPNYHHSVISLTTVGKVGAQLQEMGVEVRALEMRSALDIPRVLWQLVRLIRAARPTIVQTWMYHADLLGGVATRLAGNSKVIWGVRGSAIPQSGLSMTKMVVTLCSWTSHFLPNAIVCCAESVRIAHAKKGYDQSKMIVITNGYILAHFNRNPIHRQQIRDDFGFSDDDVVIGIVGRFDPLKDYRNFVHAATLVASNINYVKFLMIGRGINAENNELKAWLDERDLAHKIVLLGERSDVPDCLSAMDIFCLSSSNEGFPNVVCEAMAMNIPCVVTDAGDAAEIVSDTGITVATRDPIALSGALQSMINIGVAERSNLGVLARLRIENNYSIEVVSARFEALYKQLSNGFPLTSFHFLDK
jgi:glycosyltransferase involved in cell wall biosynthesis